jgi:hypothetical protein
MNLDKLIDQWIGNEQMHTLPSSYALDGKPHETEFDRGHNLKVQDLKSRKQELIEGLVNELLHWIDENQYISDDLAGASAISAYHLELYLKELTGKVY